MGDGLKRAFKATKETRMTNMPTPAPTQERIELSHTEPQRKNLPNGYFLEPFREDDGNWGYDLCSPDGVLLFGSDKMDLTQAKSFAAAMTPSPAVADKLDAEIREGDYVAFNDGCAGKVVGIDHALYVKVPKRHNGKDFFCTEIEGAIKLVPATPRPSSNAALEKRIAELEELLQNKTAS